MIFLVLSGIVTATFLLLSYRVDRKLLSVGSNTGKYPKVSVIIPAHNKVKLIKRCIDCVKASPYPNKEIIVVNDCSTDGTAEILKQIDGIKIINNKKRVGKSRSLNSAAKGVSTGLVMFLDADTFVEKNTIEKLVSSYLHYQKSEGNIGFVAPKYNIIKGQNFLARLAYMEQAIFQFLIKIQMNFDSIISTRGCCLLVDKKAFFSAGGFSDHILEDGDFAAKIKKAGYKMKYEPRARVETDEPETLNDFFRTRKRYGKGGLYCVMDHTKHYVFSKQSALSFYPYLFVSAIFLAFSIMFNGFVNTIILALPFLGVLGLASTIGMFFCGATTATDNLRKTSILTLFLPYVFFYVPFSTIGYIRGALSGIQDRWRDHEKLKLKEW